MSRMNLYIPDELKKQMDKYPSVNWSKVFQRAAENKIANLQARKKVEPQFNLLKAP